MTKLKLLFLILCCTLLVNIHIACIQQCTPTNYSRKNIVLKVRRYLIIAVGTILISDLYDKYIQNKAIHEMSDDLAITDPELYDVFLKIKKDCGIKEHIGLRVMRPNFNHKTSTPTNCTGIYDHNSCIFLNPRPHIFLHHDYKTWTKPDIIHNLVHELEHHRQFLKYPDSYHNNRKNPDNNLKLECGADAASAGYLYCHNCLRTLKGATPHPITTSKTAKYGFTTLKGYFCTDDFELYAKQAEEDNSQCHAHKTGAHTNPDTPLKDFLPCSSQTT